MRYLRTLAAAGLALLICQDPAAQSRPQQTRHATYQHDEEFLALYRDLKRFEDDNDRIALSMDDHHKNIASEAGEVFLERAKHMAKRYGFDLQSLDLSTCGNYINLHDFGSGKIMLGEFYAISKPFGNDPGEKVYVVQTKDGFKINNRQYVASDNMQPVSETGFWSLREAISLYNSQLKEESRLISKRICGEHQLDLVSSELTKMSEIELSRLPVVGYDVRTPKGSNRIVVVGIVYHDAPITYSLSIAPDGSTDVWAKDAEGGETRKEVTIKFGKPGK